MGLGKWTGVWVATGHAGLYVLAWLSHVTKMRFFGIRTVPCNKQRFEAQPGGIGPMPDGCKPL